MMFTVGQSDVYDSVGVAEIPPKQWRISGEVCIGHHMASKPEDTSTMFDGFAHE